MKYNAVALASIAEVVDMRNYSDIFRILLAWFSSRRFAIDVHKSNWSCLIVQVFAIQEKFLEPSSYYTEINCNFTFSTTNVFGCFDGINSQFESVKHSPLNSTTLYILKNTKSEAIANMSAHWLPRHFLA